MKLGSQGCLAHGIVGDHWFSTWESTLVILMEVIDELAPEVVAHLHDDVLPDYPSQPAPFHDLEPPESNSVWTILNLMMRPKWIGLPSQEREQFEAVFLRWKQRFNLDRWELSEHSFAFDARVELLLFYWSQAADESAVAWNLQSPLFRLALESKKNREWGSFARKSWGNPTRRNQNATSRLVSWGIKEEEIFPVDVAKLRPPRLPLFDPLTMTQTEYLQHVEQIAEEHVQEVKQLHELLGAENTKRKDNPDHFRRLVRYHVLGMPLDDIGDLVQNETGESHESASIQRSIRRTAKLIGLQLARKPGRPKKADRD